MSINCHNIAVEPKTKVVLFGGGGYGTKYIEKCPTNEEIIAVCDSAWTDKSNSIYGYKIISPNEISTMEFDKIVIAIKQNAPSGLTSILQIRNVLHQFGVSDSKIVLMENESNDNEVVTTKYPRVQFLIDFSKFVYARNIVGAIAECGVCYGDYSKHIATAFPDRDIFLFDTFEKFPEVDLKHEERNIADLIKSVNETIDGCLSSDAVLLRIDPELRKNVNVIKGYVPQSLEAVSLECFAYVHLDMDLYAPTIASLNFFSRRMSSNGIIAVHDYNAHNGLYTGVRRAVDEYLDSSNKVAIPIGDGTTLAIIF